LHEAEEQACFRLNPWLRNVLKEQKYEVGIAKTCQTAVEGIYERRLPAFERYI
jgi:hypothetical protein